VIVPDYQLSLAIGREGQNARLAARLTGWRIDIKSETQFSEEQRAASNPASAPAVAAPTPSAGGVGPDAGVASQNAPAEGGSEGGAEPPAAVAGSATVVADAVSGDADSEDVGSEDVASEDGPVAEGAAVEVAES
jgi:transcription termination/antitermination protein NusA